VLSGGSSECFAVWLVSDQEGIIASSDVNKDCESVEECCERNKYELVRDSSFII
jgi:hypothetical protein